MTEKSNDQKKQYYPREGKWWFEFVEKNRKKNGTENERENLNQVKKDGEELFVFLMEKIKEIDAIEIHSLHGGDFQLYGLMHQACIFYFRLIYSLCDKKVNKLFGKKRNLGGSVQLEKSQLEAEVYKTYERTKAFLKKREYLNFSYIVDAVNQIIYMNDTYGDEEENVLLTRENPIEYWANLVEPGTSKLKKYGTDVLLLRIIQKHIHDIRELYTVPLDEEEAMRMPTEVFKVDTLDGNYLLTDLETKEQLKIQGFLAKNCTGFDTWAEQIGKGKIKIFSVDSVLSKPLSGKEIVSTYKRNSDELSRMYEDFTINFVITLNKKLKIDLGGLIDVGNEFEYVSNIYESWKNGRTFRDPIWSDEAQQLFKTEREKFEKNLNMKFCRMPLCTILYDKRKHTIEQIKLHDNDLLGKETSNELVSVVFNAIVKICKILQVDAVSDLKHFRETDFAKHMLLGHVLTKDGEILKRKNVLEEDILF